MKKVLIAVVLLGGLFCAGTWFLPSKIHVERSLTINTPAATVFPYVNDLKEWEKWSPWHETEPTAQYTYSGNPGLGQSASWKGEKVGEGTQMITTSTPHTSITTSLDFADQGPATAYWNFEETGGGTKVTWGFDTDMGMNPIGKVMGLMMDKWIGGDYEKGLEKLRQVCESSAAEAPEATAEAAEVEDTVEDPAAGETTESTS